MASVSRTAVTCEQHEDEEVRFYCEDCRNMICDDCIIGGHKNHKTVKLKEFGAQRREVISKAMTKAEDEKLPRIETSIKQANEGKTHFADLVKTEMEVIKTKRKKLDDILDELQGELTGALQDTEIKAEQQYDRFIKDQERKKHKIEVIIDEIKIKGTDITDIDVAKYDVQLEDLLIHDSYADTVPNPPSPRYQFNEEFANKEKLQHFIGYIESDIYAAVVEENDKTSTNTSFHSTYLEPMSTDSSRRYTQLVSPSSKSFQIISSFDTANGVSIIIPKDEHLTAWLLDKHITEVDCSGGRVNLKLLKNLDQSVITACTNKNKDLILAFPKKNSLKQLQTTVGKLKKKTGFTVGSNKTSLACICNSPISAEEHIVCLQDKNTQEQYTIEWYKNGKASGFELSSVENNIEIDSPIQMCQNMDGNICIVCRPKSKSSWIVVVDKNGKKLLRYPTETESGAEKFDFVGAGFLKDKNIAIANREHGEQILINSDGKVIQNDKYDEKPVCCTIDHYDNVWVGFENGKVKVINYRTENEYAVVNEPTHF